MLADARAALKNKWLYLSSAALLAVLLRPTMELILSADMRAATDAMMFYSFVDAFTGIGRFIILFCILPYAASFFEECKSGYARYMLLHTTRARYMASKLLAVSLSGAVAVALPYLLMSAVALTLFQPVTAENLTGYYRVGIWEPLILSHGAAAALAVKTGMAALFGWVWSLAGLFISTLVSTRLGAYVLPLVCYQSLCTLLPDSLFHPVWLYAADSPQYTGLWQPLAMQLGYYVLFAGLSLLGMGRRLKNG